MDKRATQLGELKDTGWKGISEIVAGIVLLIAAVFILINTPFSVFTMWFWFFSSALGGLGIIGCKIGWDHLDGVYKGICPHCNHEIEVFKNATIFTCRHCKHKINRVDDTLEAFK